MGKFSFFKSFEERCYTGNRFAANVLKFMWINRSQSCTVDAKAFFVLPKILRRNVMLINEFKYFFIC